MYGLGANMKLISILPLAIVLATTNAIGQDTVLLRNPQTTPSVLMQPRTFRAECPVALQVQHGPSFQKRNTDYGPFAPPTPAVQEQRIQLTMTNPTPKEIVSAQLTVHGFSDKWRTMPLAGATSNPDLTKTVKIVLRREGKWSRFQRLVASPVYLGSVCGPRLAHLRGRRHLEGLFIRCLQCESRLVDAGQRGAIAYQLSVWPRCNVRTRMPLPASFFSNSSGWPVSRGNVP